MSIASLYPSINPSLLLDFANVKRLDPRITFTRTTTATYYDGVTTAMAEQNLLTYSQEFDNAAWSKSQVTVTANATTAPDGTSTAESMVGDGTANFHLIAQNIPALVSANTYALSMYAKANGLNYIQIHTNSSPDGRANFDITSGAGAVGTVSGNFSGAAITSVGNGWFRCTVLLTSSAAIYFQIGLISSATGARAESFTTSNGAYIWGAQLEQRSSATAYTATTTQAITNYIPVLQTAAAGQARFDHNPTTGESLGLLIEEARTNLATYSEQFDNAAWAQSYLTENITINSAVSPNGQVTADTISDSAATAEFAVGQTVAGVSANVPYTFSVFAKANNSNFLFLRYYGNADQFYYTVIFDLSLGTATKSQTGSSASNSSNTITSVGNGWYRLTVTATVNQTTLVPMIGIAASGTDTIGSFGNVSVTGTGYRSCFIWGAQLEAGPFATSYIPTTGSTATRNADAASMTGTNFSSWFNADLGSWYAEAATSFTVSSGRILSVSPASGSTDPVYSINYESNGTIRIYQVVNGSATYDFRPGNYSANTFSKIASCYKVGDYAGVVNSGSASTSSSQVRLPALSYLQIGALTSGSFFLNGTIKKLAYYPIRVTNAQLQALTA